MRARKGDCRMPGTRREGDVNRMRSDGAGLTSRYCGSVSILVDQRRLGEMTYMLIHALQLTVEPRATFGAVTTAGTVSRCRTEGFGAGILQQ